MSNPGLTKTRTASGAIAARRIVKFTANDGEVAQASAATDKLMGISTIVSAASGNRSEHVEEGIALCEFGGVTAPGDPVTSDANGKAILAAPAAGTRMRIIGFSTEVTADGVIAGVKLAPGFMTTPAA
ncbi:DUF2190 domain-containing protein [Ferrovibrio sp.]|uniref:DUF2190 domain-containing protein n=1 Tax=Ferrovibrio sp. TaxID=1917215 RepID=UPI0035B1586B